MLKDSKNLGGTKLGSDWVFFLSAQQRPNLLNFMASCKLIYTFNICFKKGLEGAEFYLLYQNTSQFFP